MVVKRVRRNRRADGLGTAVTVLWIFALFGALGIWNTVLDQQHQLDNREGTAAVEEVVFMEFGGTPCQPPRLGSLEGPCRESRPPGGTTDRGRPEHYRRVPCRIGSRPGSRNACLSRNRRRNDD